MSRLRDGWLVTDAGEAYSILNGSIYRSHDAPATEPGYYDVAGKPVPEDEAVGPDLAFDAWSEADHPRGQPENAGQFGPGGGGGKTGRKYGGLYRQTGKGAKADHLATVEHVLRNPPRAGVSYRELLARLVKDAPKHGGDVDQLKQHLGQAYENARQQLQIKALTAASSEDSVRFDEMARRAKAKAEALGWKPAGPPSPLSDAWASAGGPPAELRGFREQAQRDLVANGAKTGVEDVVGFDVKAGKPISFKTTSLQERSFVGFSPELAAAMADPGNELELHHNHPSDVSLSLADMTVTLNHPGLARTYAHGHAGSVYWCSNVKEGVVGAHVAAGDAIYIPLGLSDGLDGKQKSWLYSHIQNTALHRAGFVEYGAAPSREAATLLENHAALVSALVDGAVKAIERSVS